MYQVRVYTIDIHTINTYIFKEIIFITPEKKSHLQCITCINIKKNNYQTKHRQKPCITPA